jgi:hypothetical protein
MLLVVYGKFVAISRTPRLRHSRWKRAERRPDQSLFCEVPRHFFVA